MMIERENILRILINSEKAVEEENPFILKQLSNETIHTSSSTEDSDNILVSVIVYALGKILERPNYKTMDGWKVFYQTVLFSLKASIEDLKKGDEEKFRKDFVKIRKAISKISGKLKNYIQDVFEKSKINKASRIYEHGVSLEKTSKLLGVTVYDLANYSGQTGVSEVSLNGTINEKIRVKILEGFFNGN